MYYSIRSSFVYLIFLSFWSLVSTNTGIAGVNDQTTDFVVDASNENGIYVGSVHEGDYFYLDNSVGSATFGGQNEDYKYLNNINRYVVEGAWIVAKTIVRKRLKVFLDGCRPCELAYDVAEDALDFWINRLLDYLPKVQESAVYISYVLKKRAWYHTEDYHYVGEGGLVLTQYPFDRPYFNGHKVWGSTLARYQWKALSDSDVYAKAHDSGDHADNRGCYGATFIVECPH